MCCGYPMTVVPAGRYAVNLHCACCNCHTTANEPPREERDPFACDDPRQALNDYQRGQLERNWHRDGFGQRYQQGLWSRCELANVIRAWHTTMPERGLLISGSKGTGKTVATGLIMVCLAARNEFSFAWWNMSSLLTLLHNWGGWSDKNLAEDAALDIARSCKYLFLDDLGVEYNSPLAMSRFNELIETRYARQLCHIATSNLNEAALSAREGWERIVDRIQEDVYDWCEIGGASKRRESEGR